MNWMDNNNDDKILKAIADLRASINRQFIVIAIWLFVLSVMLIRLSK